MTDKFGMKIYFMTFLIVCLPLSLWGQQQSGGHPDVELPEPFSEEVEVELKKSYDSLLKISNEQWNGCAPVTKEKFESFGQLYLQMMWMDPDKTDAKEDCVDNKKVNCFFSPKIKKAYKDFLSDKDTSKYFDLIEGKGAVTKSRLYFNTKILD